jgi:hypothetical protein
MIAAYSGNNVLGRIYAGDNTQHHTKKIGQREIKLASVIKVMGENSFIRIFLLTINQLDQTRHKRNKTYCVDTKSPMIVFRIHSLIPVEHQISGARGQCKIRLERKWLMRKAEINQFSNEQRRSTSQRKRA